VIYSYIVKKRHLTDVEKECLSGQHEVLSSLSPRELRQLHCADFLFSSGDTFVLQPKAVDLASAVAVE
jgi:hypothetical protein